MLHNTILVNILSDNGSNNSPNLDTTLNFLARYPSKKSLIAPNVKHNIAPILKLFFKVYINNGDTKTLKILKQLGTIFIKRIKNINLLFLYH